MLGEQFRGRGDRGGERGPVEDAEKGDASHRHGVDGDEPEDQVRDDRGAEVDEDGEALADERGDEAEHDAADGEAGPESDGAHARGEGRRVPDAQGIRHHPAADGDLDADDDEDEPGADPRHLVAQRLLQAPAFGLLRHPGLRMQALAVARAVQLPEGGDGDDQLEGLEADHQVVPVVPGEAALGDHGRGDERPHGAAEPVAPVQDAEDLVGVLHRADHGVPGGVFETHPEPGQHVCEHQDGVGRVHGDDDVGDQAGSRADEGDAAGAVARVHGVVEHCGGEVAD